MPKLQATFGDALLRAHRALLRDLQALQKATQPRREGQPAELAACLDRTRDDLAEHFRFEEENGYLGAVLQLHPHLARVVGRLAEEHGELLRCLDALRAEARSAAGAGDVPREKVIRWIRSVRLHERRENILVQDAFCLDLSAED
jgi:hypothetical protein